MPDVKPFIQYGPKSMAVYQSNLYVNSAQFSLVTVFPINDTYPGHQYKTITTNNVTSTYLYVSGISIDDDGYLYAGDANSNTFCKYSGLYNANITQVYSRPLDQFAQRVTATALNNGIVYVVKCDSTRGNIYAVHSANGNAVSGFTPVSWTDGRYHQAISVYNGVIYTTNIGPSTTIYKYSAITGSSIATYSTNDMYTIGIAVINNYMFTTDNSGIVHLYYAGNGNVHTSNLKTTSETGGRSLLIYGNYLYAGQFASNTDKFDISTYAVSPFPSAPVITYANVYSNNTANVYFTQSGSLTGYYYSTNGTSYTQIASTASPIQITSGINVNASVTLSLMAYNSAGNSGFANVTIGNAPIITSITPKNLSLQVGFTPSSGTDVVVNNYKLSTDGGTTYQFSTSTSPYTITGLIAGQTYNVTMVAANTYWTSANSAVVTARPYNVGTAPSITATAPLANSISVSFNLSNDAYDAPNYYYSYQGNNVNSYYLLSPTPTSSPNTFIINNVTTLANVVILAVNGAGNVYSANVYQNSYYFGTNPNIISVNSLANSLSVSFYATQGGNPLITAGNYYYSIDGGATVSPANPTFSGSNTFVIYNLTTYTSYTVQLYSSNPAGYLYSTSPVTAVTPYVIANVAPTILNVYSSLNSLLVSFANVQNSNPLPYYYYTVYNVDGGSTIYSSGNSGVTSNVSGNLNISVTVAGNYKVQLTAVNPAGNISSANVTGYPYILGSQPNIISVIPGKNSLSVYFNTSIGGSIPVSYYYSINGNSAANYTLASITTNPNVFTISTTSLNANISVLALNGAGNVYSATTFIMSPYLIGTAPTITSIRGNYSSMQVTFNASTGANPAPFYYYSIDGQQTYSNSFTNSNALPFYIATPNPANSYQVSIYGVNVAGNTTVSNQITVGNVPVINNITPGNLSLFVSFTGSMGASSYNYSIDGGLSFGNLASVSNGNFTILNVLSTVAYSVAVRANGVTWYTTSNVYSPSVAPYAVGSEPSITSYTYTSSSFTITFTGPVGANPAPTAYYYNINGTGYVNATVVNNNITVNNLTGSSYSVQIIAQNVIGNTAPSAAYYANIYTIGSAPVITNVVPFMDAFAVYFSNSVGGYPVPTSYYYSVNGGTTYGNTGGNSSPIYIYGNYSNRLYPITIISQNLVGNTSPSNAYNAQNYDVNGADIIFANLVSGGTDTVKYTSVATIGAGSVDLKTNANITLGTRTISSSRIISPSGSNFTSGSLTFATDSTGNIYIQNVSNNVVYVHDSSATYLNKSVNASYRYYCSVTPPASIPNTIWFGGDSGVSVLNTATLIFTNYPLSYSVRAMAYNPANGDLYGSQSNALKIYKGTSLTGPSNVLVASASVGSTGTNDYFIGLTFGPDGNLYGITRYYGVIYRFLPDGTQLGQVFTNFSYPANSTIGLDYNSRLGVFYATRSDTNSTYITQISLNGTLTTFTTLSNTSGPIFSRFDDVLGYYYVLYGAGSGYTGLQQYVPYPLTLSYTFADSLLLNNFQPLRLYNGATPIGSSIQVLGSAPSITNVYSAVNGLNVIINTSTGALPNPFYWYSTNGTTYSNSQVYSNSLATTANIFVPGLTTYALYNVYIMARNSAGNVQSTNYGNGYPYVTGSKPNITSVTSTANPNVLYVNFNSSVGANPAPFYYYNISGTTEYANTNSTVNSTIAINNVTPGVTYTVTVMALNIAGNVYGDSVNTGIAAIGTNPNVVSVTSLANAISVSFQPSINCYPAPTYYYSLDGGITFSNANISTLTANSFTIGNLFQSVVSNVSVMAQNSAGNAYSQTQITGQPYIIGNVAPTISDIQSGLNSLSVSFNASTGGYTNPFYYYNVYSTVQANILNANSGLNSNASAIVIRNLNVAGNYTVQLIAVNPAGTLYSANVPNCKPYILGTQPTISNIVSISNGITVNFSASNGGYPAPYYYYSLDNGITYSNANVTNQTATSLTIGNLTTINTYTVSLAAINAGGNVYSSNTYLGSPYVVGNTLPNITNIQSNVTSLLVSYTGSVGAYPTPYYYYSVNNAAYANSNLNAQTGNITIPGLLSGTLYTITLMAVNAAGNLVSANANATTYGVGTKPNITSGSNIANGFSISFNASTGGYPAPSYLYAVNGNANYVPVSVSIGGGGNTFTVNNLTTANSWTVYFMAQNFAGNVYSSTTYTGIPLVVGNTNPNITSIQSLVNSVKIFFTGSVGANPQPNYYYTINGVVSGNYASTTSNILIQNLTVAGPYFVTISAQNPAGTIVSTTANAYPYVVGTQPILSSIASTANSITVAFQPSVGGYPNPVYFYSLTGNVTAGYANAFSNPNASINLLSNTLVISNLYTTAVQNVVLLAQNDAGNLYSSNVLAQSATLGVKPTITNVSGGLNSLIVQFAATIGGYPAPYYYYNVYSVYGNILNANSGFNSNSSNIVIQNLTIAGNYTVQLMAINTAGTLYSTSVANCNPYIIGTKPNVLSVASVANGLSVGFQTSTGGYPLPTYYYSLDGGSTYSTANITNLTSSSLIISNLFTASTYSVSIAAVSVAGNVYSEPSSILSGNPYVLGTAPVITQLNSNINSLDVYFNASVGAYTDPFYYYSVTSLSGGLNGGAYANSTLNSNVGFINIPGFTRANVYAVRLMAVNPAGNVVSVAANGQPYLIGTAPSITSIKGNFSSITVSFQDAADAYPKPYYYYSLNGTTYSNSLASSSPFTLTGKNFSITSNVSIYGVNMIGNTATSNYVMLGNVPVINSVTQGNLSLTVSFSGPPDATSYNYSIDGGATFPNVATVVGSNITISNLRAGTAYSVAIQANNAMWSMNSNAYSPVGPYTVGSAPVITSAITYLNTLNVGFTGTSDANPPPTTYYYSLNSGAYVNINSISSPFTIPNVPTGNYTLDLIAHNLIGNTAPSTTYNGNLVSIPIGNVAPFIESISVANFCVANNAVYYESNTNLNTFYKYSLYGEYLSTITFTGITISQTQNMCYVQNAGQNGRIYMCTWAYSDQVVRYIDCGNNTSGSINITIAGVNQTPCGVATDGAYLYFINNSRGMIYQCDFSGNYVSTILSEMWFGRVLGGQGNSGIVCSGDYIYIGDSVGFTALSTVARVSISSKTLSLQWIASTSVAALSPVAVDQYFIYVLSTTSNQICQYSLLMGGSTPVNTFTITGASGTCNTINSDGTFLYASNGTKIYKIRTNQPPSLGGAFRISGVSSLANGLSVNINLSTGGWPPPIYYYSINGGSSVYDIANPQPSGSANTFTISGLTAYSISNVSVLAQYVLGNVYSSNTFVAQSYVIGNVAPTILNVYSDLNRMLVSFTPVQYSNPLPYYYYKVYNSANQVAYSGNSGLTTNSANISINSVALGNYTVQLTAVNAAGNISSANVAGFPYILGTAPIINSVSSAANSLVVGFGASSGGFPPPTYYYSANGNAAASYVQFGSYSNPYTITSLYAKSNIALMARYAAGNVYSANTFVATPYYLGTQPNVTSVVPGANSLSVSFTATVGGYPLTVAGNYYYSIDGGASVSSANPTIGNTFVIDGLTTYQSYVVSFYSSNPAGNMYSATTPQEVMPYVIGNVSPNITLVTSILNGLQVDFTSSKNANPSPFYYYKVYNVDTNTISVPLANSYINSNVGGRINITVSVAGNYAVQLTAVSPAGNVSTANVAGNPYIRGSNPNINSVSPLANALSVSMNLSVDGYPSPSYYYSLSGNTDPASFVQIPLANITGAANTFVINGIYGSANVFLLAQNAAGNVYSASSVFATSYYLGTTPDIISVESQVNSLLVSFNATAGGYPLTVAGNYYYSIDGGASVYSANPTLGNTFVISDLTTLKSYTVSLYSSNPAGNLYSATTPSPQPPYVVGNVAPNITLVTSILNGLQVNFTSAQNANPTPFYYYSVDGNAFANSGYTDSSNPIIISNLTLGTHTVRLMAVNTAGNVYSVTSSGQPYIAGTHPNIIRVEPRVNSLAVLFYPSLNAYDTPVYYYSLRGNDAAYYVSAGVSGSANSFVIGNLSTLATSNVSLLAVNAAGNVYSDTTVLQTPYVVGNVAPSIVQVYSNVNSLLVEFTPAQNANPTPYYYYSVDGNAYANSGLTTNNANIYIPNLTVAGNYSVSIMAVNAAGNVASANSYGHPYVVGSSPEILSVANLANCLSISFQGVGGWNPQPTYYYSIQGNSAASYVLANVNGNGFVTTNIYVANTYYVALLAKNVAGNVYSSNIGVGNPYVLGTATPAITRVQSGVNRITVEFDGAVGAFPAPFYYYSVDGNAYANSGFNTNTNIVISNLTVAGNYSVSIMSVNPAGRLISANAYGQPYVLGTVPSISNIQSNYHSLIISFNASTGAYSDPYYYYSVDGQAYANSGITSNATSIVIGNLDVAKPYTINLLAVNPAGNLVSANASGTPYIVGSRPNIISVTSITNSLSVAFQPSIDGYPEPIYYYSVDGGITYIKANIDSTANSLVIGNLASHHVYSVSMLAVNAAGNAYSAYTVSGEPYSIGSAPIITDVSSGIYSLIINFVGSVGGVPDPYTYLYSLDGGASFVDSGTVVSPIVVGNLITATVYDVCIKGVSLAGNTTVSNVFMKEPYVIGEPPTISVDSSLNSLIIYFADTPGGNPDAYTYVYSLNGTDYLDAQSNISPIIVGNLTSPTAQTVSIKAINLVGVSPPSNTVVVTPYVIGLAPVINKLTIVVNGFIVDFSGSIGGYPAPTTYLYSLDGGVTYTDSLSNVSPISIENLSPIQSYTVCLKAVNAGGLTLPSNSLTETPFTVIEPAVVNSVVPINNNTELEVHFDPSPGIYQAPLIYLYSINGSNFIGSECTNSPLIINYPSLPAVSTRGFGLNTITLKTVLEVASYTAEIPPQYPYVIGTAPSIVSVSSGYNGLSVSFIPSIGGYPVPATYYYSLDGGDYLDSRANTSPIFIGGLTQPRSYTVSLVASSLGGNTLPSATETGTPYVIGTAPNISSVERLDNGLLVHFAVSTGGYPQPTTYMFSLDGVNYANSGSTTSPITITNLSPIEVYAVSLTARSIVGDSVPSNTVYASPFSLETAPIITNAQQNASRLTVSFLPCPNTVVYPSPIVYYYSLNSDGEFRGSNYQTSPIVVDGVLSQVNNVKLRGLLEITTPSNQITGRPYIIGTPPVIANVQSIEQGIVINFSGGTGGYPDVTTYYYSINNGNTFVNANTTVSPITLTGFTKPTYCYVVLIGHNAGGNTAVSNMYYQVPYIIGTTPIVGNVTSAPNSLVVEFIGSFDGFPDPVSYYYSTDGINYIDSGTVTSPLIVPNLTTPETFYGVSIKTYNSRALGVASNTVYGRPYVAGYAPIIIMIQNRFEELTVSFVNNGAYPTPTKYYYSVNDDVEYVSAEQKSSPLVATGLNCNSRYIVRVHSENIAGKSPNSAGVSMWTRSTKAFFRDTMNSFNNPHVPIYIGNQPNNSKLNNGTRDAGASSRQKYSQYVRGTGGTRR